MLSREKWGPVVGNQSGRFSGLDWLLFLVGGKISSCRRRAGDWGLGVGVEEGRNTGHWDGKRGEEMDVLAEAWRLDMRMV